MYVYRTPLFNQQVEQQTGLHVKVNKLCEELETLKLDEAQSRFERLFPYLKRKEGNLRLIARIRRVGNEAVLCWLTVFRRGDPQYQEFLRHHASFNLDTHLSDAELQRWLTQCKAKSQILQPATQPLDAALLHWLNHHDWEAETDNALIYETETWIQQFQTSEIGDRAHHYSHIILKIVDQSHPLGAAQDQNLWLYGENNCYILYSRITPIDHSKREIILLISCFFQVPEPFILEPLRQQFNLATNLTFDQLTAFAKRAYPSYLLLDPQIWLEIEQEQAVNLALSVEEEAISQKPLPLFLNGQAGSGKSTMLFHLFADYCYRHFKYCQEQERDFLAKPHPLFLVYNERLLEVARKQVKTLLLFHYRFLEKRNPSEQIPDISPFFQSFRRFLCNLLPLAERDEFTEAKYISFHRFRQLLRHAWQNYSPELSWQVIRTFIKGYHLDERDTYLSLEDYQELPAKEKTVSESEFAWIYQNIWSWYNNRTKETGEWDDQDLIRRILKRQYYPSEYTAIFCDEAQDFTRLELQLIMRLSVFSQYDLEHHHISSLPFAFAGDPLQTLNPTGFRWANLKSAFYHEVITGLSPSGKLKLGMNFHELECNYRSSHPIVGVNNLIQLWRKVLFKIAEIKPQISRKIGQLEPEKFILDFNVTSEQLAAYLQDKIIIIPCDEGEEWDYVSGDGILRQLKTLEMSQESPWNVLSAIAAKGLEFKQVILYQFGEKLSEFSNRETWNPDYKKPEAVKYFFNKLYVAASRATESLFIIDSKQGDEVLWERASNPSEVEKFLQLSGVGNHWRERIQRVNLGTSLEAIPNSDPAHLFAIAREFETQGLNSENPDLLRRAKGAYTRLNNPDKAQSCEAWALRFEGEYLEAGQQFIHLNEADLAWDCFWLGKGWRELKNWCDHYPNSNTEQRPLVEFLASLETQEQLLKIETVNTFTCFLATSLNQELLNSQSLSQSWRVTINEYARQVSSIIASNTSLSTEDYQQLGSVLTALAQVGYKGLLEDAGTCFYRMQNYQQAIECWETSEAMDKREYALAKAQILGFPRGLEYLEKIKDYNRILTEWKAANQPEDLAWFKSVSLAWEHQKRYGEILRYALRLGDIPKSKQAFRLFTQEHLKPAYLKSFVTYLIQQQYWQDALESLETYLPQLSVAEPEMLQVCCDILYAISQSSLTPEELEVDSRKAYEKFITERVLAHENWQQYLYIPQLGVALEKIGSLSETLEFYEQYFKHPDTQIQRFAQERWLATKLKQEEYFKKQKQFDKAANSRAKIMVNAQRWKIKLEQVSLDLPVVTKSRPNLSHLVATGSSTSSSIQGLPPGILIEQLKSGVQRLQVKHLTIKISTLAKQVLIVDHLSNQEVRVDLARFQVHLGDFKIAAERAKQLSFVATASGYSGVISQVNQQFACELEISGLPDKILIRF